MAIAKVQAFPKAGSVSGTSDTVAITADTTAGNYLVLMVAATGGRVVSSVTDSKGNTWTVNYFSGNGVAVGCSVAYAKMVDPLVNGDTITVNLNAAGIIAAVAQEYSGIHATSPLRTDAPNGQGWLTSTAATGGATAGAAEVGDLVLGVFAGQGAGAIATPGAGYDNETGAATTGTVVTLDWQSRSAAAAAAQTATATWSASTNGAGGTIVFAPAPAAGGGAPQPVGRRRDVSNPGVPSVG